jgi:hypothetical protein
MKPFGQVGNLFRLTFPLLEPPDIEEGQIGFEEDRLRRLGDADLCHAARVAAYGIEVVIGHEIGRVVLRILALGGAAILGGGNASSQRNAPSVSLAFSARQRPP